MRQFRDYWPDGQDSPVRCIYPGRSVDTGSVWKRMAGARKGVMNDSWEATAVYGHLGSHDSGGILRTPRSGEGSLSLQGARSGGEFPGMPRERRRLADRCVRNIKQMSMDNNRNGGSMDKDGHITDFRDALAGRSELEAPRWRLALALTLIVLCCLIGVVIGVCEL